MSSGVMPRGSVALFSPPRHAPTNPGRASRSSGRAPRARLQLSAALNGGGGGSKGNPEQRHHPLRKALAGAEPIGAEYGEGFLQFRLSGEHTRLDVDKLNEQLRVGGADRIRHTMCPDEQFGLVFCFDNVVSNTRALQRQAWQRVAAAQGLPFPSLDRPQLFEVRPERAALDVLQWTRDMGRARALAWDVATAYAELLAEIDQPLPGVREWLALMSRTNVPCALVTQLDRATAFALLDRLGLRHHFSAVVTADDDMETLAQRFLSAAIKLGRPPEQCVVFGACPAAVAAAHNCTMRAVALMQPHTAPQLRAADLTIGSMTELTVYNLRRLFANKGAEFMDLRQGRVGQKPPARRLKHATDDPEAPR